MFDTKHYECEAVSKIANICTLLDEDLKAHPTSSKKIVATMYYLASLRIKHAFGVNIEGFHTGHRELYALSGFKQPINQLLEIYAESDEATAEKIRHQLVQISNHFDDRFGEITQRQLTEYEYLNTRSEILSCKLAKRDQHSADFY